MSGHGMEGNIFINDRQLKERERELCLVFADKYL